MNNATGARPSAPSLDRPSSSAFHATVPDGKLLARGQIAPVHVEQYQRLAVALQELQDRSRWSGPSATERGLKTVLVTSTLPREGKTLTALNIACSLSEFIGRRVLVIDGHLRNPSIHAMLGLPMTAGLDEFLSSRVPDIPLLQVSPLMSVLLAGQSDSKSHQDLSSERVRTLLDDCSLRFDWVLLDGPPVALLSNPHQLSRIVRAVLFVIGSRSTPTTSIERAVSDLGRGSIIGTVMNRADHIS